MKTEYTIKPIGFFSGKTSDRYSLPRQPDSFLNNSGTVLLNKGYNYEQAVVDLNSFSKIWIIYLFHRNSTWKPKVMPPRGGIKRGLFATRSPHRPNPIGISCVNLLSVSKNSITIANHDLLDGTPILDIKPYIPYADAHPDASHGWLEEFINEEKYEVIWESRLEEKLLFLEKHSVELCKEASKTLSENPFPYPSRRITKVSETEYTLAYKTWRISYSIDEERLQVTISSIFSGYTEEELSSNKPSKWNDQHVHRSFNLL